MKNEHCNYDCFLGDGDDSKWLRRTDQIQSIKKMKNEHCSYGNFRNGGDDFKSLAPTDQIQWIISAIVLLGEIFLKTVIAYNSFF